MLNDILLREGPGEWLHFQRPVRQLTAFSPADVMAVLAEVERAVNEDGLFAAGFLGYEAAGGFDAALVTHEPGALPLLCFGLFEEPSRLVAPPPVANDSADAPHWRLSTARERYLRDVARIRDEIARGNTYQVNYTVRLVADEALSARTLFDNVASDAPCAALLQGDDFDIVSASPELFFRLDGDRIVCEPMKGTAERGLTAADDRVAGERLRSSRKDRAENVMIADMVRNDLGRIAIPGSVEVQSLYDTHRFPTLWQLTSTVTARTAAPLVDVFRALFPSASITGAPKSASMRLVRELEPTPREIYTGAIGWLGPGRQARFSVAIRTAWIDRRSGEATYGVGSGIVWDSVAEAEYEECEVKSRILRTTQEARRFELLETLRWTPGEGYFLLDLHLDRLLESAGYFDFAVEAEELTAALEEAAKAFGSEPRRVRLTADRYGKVRVSALPLPPPEPVPIRIRLAAAAIDRRDPFLYHKTTRRTVYDEARRNAGPCDDVLLWNEDGLVTETCIANIVVRHDGRRVTPPVSCGLLAGTLRRQLLEQQRIIEAPVRLDSLSPGDEITLINSVRGEYSGRIVR